MTAGKMVVVSVFLLLCTLAQQVHALRLVSTVGAITELVYALGAEEHLIAVDSSSLYPVEAQALPQIGYMRALSVEGIAALEPDLVLVTDDAGPPYVIKALEQMGIKVFRLNSDASVDGLFTRIEQIAVLLKREETGQQLKGRLRQQRQQLQDRLDSTFEEVADRKRALFIMSHGGHALSIAGEATSADSLLELAGLDNVAQGFEAYRTLGQEGLVNMNPDLIITTSQSVQGWGSAEKLLKHEGIQFTTAAREGKLLAMDALYLLGFGPRVFEAAMRLHDQAYP